MQSFQMPKQAVIMSWNDQQGHFHCVRAVAQSVSMTLPIYVFILKLEFCSKINCMTYLALGSFFPPFFTEVLV